MSFRTLVSVFCLVAMFVVSSAVHITKGEKKQVILFPPASKHRNPSTLLLYGTGQGSGEDSDTDKETVESLSNNVLSLSSLVTAQSEVIENLSREVAGLRETVGSQQKQGEECAKNSKEVNAVEEKVKRTNSAVTKLKAELYKVQRKSEKTEKVVKKLLKETEEEVEEVEEECEKRYEKLKGHVDNLNVSLKYTKALAGKKGWPDGHYCILASGRCPAGFKRSQGHLNSLYLYSQHKQFIEEATFGSSHIGCFGKYCGQYGNFIGSLKIVACCK